MYLAWFLEDMPKGDGDSSRALCKSVSGTWCRAATAERISRSTQSYPRAVAALTAISRLKGCESEERVTTGMTPSFLRTRQLHIGIPVCGGRVHQLFIDLVTKGPGRLDDDISEVVRLEGFGNEVEGPYGQGLPGDLQGGIAGDDDDFCPWGFLQDPFQHLQAVHLVHPKIRHHNVQILLGDLLEGRLRIGEGLGFYSELGQCWYT